eukprot:7338206-Pyramimonas_sp.AAC.1
MGGLRPEILASHVAQQANLSTQLARQRRNQERRLRRVINRAGAPAAPAAAGRLAMGLPAEVAIGSMPVVPQTAPAFPPGRSEMGESRLDR